MKRIFAILMLIASMTLASSGCVFAVSTLTESEVESNLTTAQTDFIAEYQTYTRSAMRDIQVLMKPIGAIYMTSSGNLTTANLTTYFGGSWEQIQNRFLYNYSGAPGGTGGAYTVTLTAAQVPNHSHNISGSHNHSVLLHHSAKAGSNHDQLTSDKPTGYSYTTTTNGAGSYGAAGSGGSHPNMPPYTVVKMFRRTG